MRKLLAVLLYYISIHCNNLTLGVHTLSRRAGHGTSVGYLDNLLLQFKWACETSRRPLLEGSCSRLFPGQPNLTPTWAKILDALDLSYTVLCKLYWNTRKKFLTAQKEKEWSKRPREKLAKVVQGPFCIMATPHSPTFLLRVTACPSFYISSNTSSFQRHSSLRDTAAARVQLLFQILRVAEHLEIKGGAWVFRPCFAVLKFQLWNLFCATAWNINVGAVPKFAQWKTPTKQYKISIDIYDIRHTVMRESKNARGNMNK